MKGKGLRPPSRHTMSWFGKDAARGGESFETSADGRITFKTKQATGADKKTNDVFEVIEINYFARGVHVP